VSESGIVFNQRRKRGCRRICELKDRAMRKLRILWLFLVTFLTAAAAQTLDQPATVISNPSPPSSSPQPNPTPTPPQTPSDELNSHLPFWLRFSGQVRFRGAGAIDESFGSEDASYLLTRLRLNMQLIPTSWINFYFQGQDAHIIGAKQTASLPPLQQDTMDLRLGYVELGGETKAVSVRVGRQELAFGEERLIGPADWLNTPRSFDAASAAIHINGITLDAFAGAVVKIHDGQFNESTPGNYIYGLYSSLSKVVPQAKLEPYFFWRRQSGLTVQPGTLGVSNFGTLGFRFVGKSLVNGDYDVEMAKQTGSLGPETVAAWAGHWLIGYTVSGKRLSPRFVTEFNYATGNNSKDGRVGTFNQLFPSGHNLYGLTDQVGWQNIQHVRTGVELKARSDWTVSAKYNAYWLADPHDALYNVFSTAIASSPSGKAGSYVGQELDVIASHKYKAGPVLSGGFGHLFPGTFLQATTPGKGYSFPYASILYPF
jgi:hypothetical protein